MKRYAIILSILLLVVVPSVLAQTDNSNVLLRNTVGGNITTLNPVLESDSASIDVSNFIWAGLFNVDPQTAQPEPALTTWKISPDGLTYTFTIVDGAKAFLPARLRFARCMRTSLGAVSAGPVCWPK